MKLPALILALLLTGCAEWSAMSRGVAEHGAQAADAELRAAEWGLCKAATIGAWVRAYGNNPDKADAWRKLCATEVKATP